GRGAGHGGGEQASRVRTRPAALRHRSANPARPRRPRHPPPDEQPAEGDRPRRVRPTDRGTRADPDARGRPQPRLPPDQEGQTRPPARRDRRRGGVTSMAESDHILAHEYSSHHRGELERSEKCGCFYCLAVFTPRDITHWLNEGDGTALCPHCTVDSVVGD